VSAPRERGVKARTKLSYKETRELEALPREIEVLEAEQKALAAKMAGADYYRQPHDTLRGDQARTAEIERLLLEKLERWEELEARSR
jgi:ATP-binding cassette subfamily F protein uup